MIKVFRDSAIDFTYGKAQKLVNIAFKNFLFFKGADEDYFTYCHTPIDNNVLKWCINIAKIKCRRDGWSKMGFEEYICLQQEIRAYLDNKEKNKHYYYEDGTPVSNLVVDCYAWVEGGHKDDLKNYWNNTSVVSDFYRQNKEIIRRILNDLN